MLGGDIIFAQRRSRPQGQPPLAGSNYGVMRGVNWRQRFSAPEQIPRLINSPRESVIPKSVTLGHRARFERSRGPSQFTPVSRQKCYSRDGFRKESRALSRPEKFEECFTRRGAERTVSTAPGDNRVTTVYTPASLGKVPPSRAEPLLS